MINLTKDELKRLSKNVGGEISTCDQLENFLKCPSENGSLLSQMQKDAKKWIGTRSSKMNGLSEKIATLTLILVFLFGYVPMLETSRAAYYQTILEEYSMCNKCGYLAVYEGECYHCGRYVEEK